jgi:chromosomal replication initiator protein
VAIDQQGAGRRRDFARGRAFFRAYRTNVRELEGPRRRDHAPGELIIDFAKEALKDLLNLRRAWTIENIQKTVADYYKLRMSDLGISATQFPLRGPAGCHGAGQGTDIAQPAGNRRFGGRDHTTVIHAAARASQARGCARTTRTCCGH